MVDILKYLLQGTNPIVILLLIFLIWQVINHLPTQIKELKSDVKRLDDKIDSNQKELNNKIERNHNELNNKIDSNQKELNNKVDSNHNELKDLIIKHLADKSKEK